VVTLVFTGLAVHGVWKGCRVTRAHHAEEGNVEINGMGIVRPPPATYGQSEKDQRYQQPSSPAYGQSEKA